MNLPFSETLNKQCTLHPNFTPQDALKLCYQATFGAEHLLTDPIGAQQYFEQELSTVQPSDFPNECLIEPISEEFCRVNLRQWKAKQLPSAWLFALFLESTKALQSTAAHKTAVDSSNNHNKHATASGANPALTSLTNLFEASLTEITMLCHQEKLPFSVPDWETALAHYRKDGIRPVHHSERYRAAEQPAYRLVRTRLLPLLPLLEQLRTLPTPPEGSAIVLAIDGRCGAGKTTLATALAALLQTDLIQMDDFFLPPAKRDPCRLATPGGNVDYERFGLEVLPFLDQSNAFSYQKFECSTMQLGAMRHIRAGNWRVVEGSYSHHPHFEDYADLRVFVTTDAETQLTRILARNGATWAEDFKNKWIPMEESYFDAYHILQKADIILTNKPV